MIEDASAGLPSAPDALTLKRVVRLASFAFCLGLPIAALALLYADLFHAHYAAVDFRQFYQAADAIRHGKSPYGAADVTAWGGPYPYPPLPAFLAMPFTVLPPQAAAYVVVTILVFVALAIPYVLGVRDVRCYGLMFLWPPVLQAIQTGNLTLWFSLAIALAWRFRDRLLAPSAAIGLTLAAKFFLWPLVAWLVATRRFLAAALSVVFGAGLLLISWTVIGFAGFTEYPDILRRLEKVVGPDSYTAYIVGLDLGLPSLVARGIWLILGLLLVVATVSVARRDERRGLILGIAASLALTPIVWLHYFALLVVVVALAQPTLSVVWFIPLAMIITPGSGHPTPFQTAATFVAAALTIALSLRGRSDERDVVTSELGHAPSGAPA